MAVLQKPVSTGSAWGDLGPLAPEGTFLAVCVDIKDQFGVTRRKFQSEETETVDLTSFCFGFRDRDGNKFKIATMPMKQSGHEKSALYKFLRSWLGKAPKYGWDYCEMKGQKALITIEHKPNKDGSDYYANLVNVIPVPEGMALQPNGNGNGHAAAKPGNGGSKPPAPKAPPPPAEDIPLADDVVEFPSQDAAPAAAATEDVPF